MQVKVENWNFYDSPYNFGHISNHLDKFNQSFN